MPNLNKVLIMGHLGKDAETKTLPSGVALTTFSVATSDKWKDKAGLAQEKTEWHLVEVWGKGAEYAASLKKGMAVYVEGKISSDEWMDKEGHKRRTTKIKADRIQGLTPKAAADAALSADDIPFGWMIGAILPATFAAYAALQMC